MIERTFIEQGMKKIQLEEFLKKELSRAGFTGLQMVKTPLVTRIALRVARPGLAIGKGGQNIKQLTEEIGKRFGIDNPQIEIQDIQRPELDARATVDKMVELIERGFSWKSVSFRTVRTIIEAGAQGVELILKGKLSGKGGRKRKHRTIHGYMKKVGDQVKLVDVAKASAYPKAGAIGITLRIIKPGVVFPDKVDIDAEIEKHKAVAEKAAAATVAAEATAPKGTAAAAETAVPKAVAIVVEASAPVVEKQAEEKAVAAQAAEEGKHAENEAKEKKEKHSAKEQVKEKKEHKAEKVAHEENEKPAEEHGKGHKEKKAEAKQNFPQASAEGNFPKAFLRSKKGFAEGNFSPAFSQKAAAEGNFSPAFSQKAAAEGGFPQAFAKQKAEAKQESE